MKKGNAEFIFKLLNAKLPRVDVPITAKVQQSKRWEINNTTDDARV